MRERKFVDSCHVLLYGVFTVSPTTWLHSAFSDEFTFGSHWCSETAILLYTNSEAVQKTLYLKTVRYTKHVLQYLSETFFNIMNN